jgi:hypothetical protein
MASATLYIKVPGFEGARVPGFEGSRVPEFGGSRVEPAWQWEARRSILMSGSAGGWASLPKRPFISNDAITESSILISGVLDVHHCRR